MNDQTQNQNQGWFTNFFKGCGCMGADDKASQSSNMSKRKLLPKNNNEAENDHLSVASNTEWIDLEDFPIQFTNGNDNRGTGFTDDYISTDIIDFGELRKITGVDEDEEKRSEHSNLSRDSKKIKKNKPAAKKENGEKEKGAKIRGKRNPWQPHEDARLIELVNKHGQSWALIASMIDGRTGKQVRDRYLNILRPNIKKGDWTPQEDQHILNLFYQFGAKWSMISNYVPGRTEGQVKNRFYAHIKKKILVNDNINTSPPQFSGQVTPHENLYPSSQSNTGSNMFPPSPQTHSDIADVMISYSEENKVPRNGSNEIFLEQPNGNPSPKSMGSQRTNYTGPGSEIRDERDVDDFLDKIAGFFEKQQTNQEGSRVNLFSNENSTTGKLESVEQLQKRRQALQFLLMQTNNQINTFLG